ncbi:MULTISPECIES: VOC family protein [Streptomyces]|uniref:27 kDa antigen Cfp30B n=1 Tax=Streptomyces chartreusis NRRL 3882 TaxID=1079985 RepID=A0A2N9BLH0_STRCX|nr:MULTISPECIES: VOC family protein [Streptomyces]MYS88580.1 VOC family protein [Streptomyces sp. SID5464]SOR84198.1 27 kDa antigen Cfp30B [Streptomyces chartreusis NRRL 3882]
MTTRLGSVNEFCWMDLKTRDLPGTAAFFSTTLGWRFAVDEEDRRRATKITLDGHLIGGVSDLAHPVYPPGTPAHIAYYLAVEDIERRIAVATAHGARIVVPPFDAGDQGRMATLIDPAGAAFSLWQAHHFTGWQFPLHLASAPHRMVLACERPDEARNFYRETAGSPLTCADFVAPRGGLTATPQWELAIGVDDLDSVVTRVREQGRSPATWQDETGRCVVRLTSPEGLTFQIRRLER